MQGRLRNRKLSAVVYTDCARTGQPIEIAIDSDLRYRVLSEGACPVLSVPLVNLGKLDYIYDAF